MFLRPDFYLFDRTLIEYLDFPPETGSPRDQRYVPTRKTRAASRLCNPFIMISLKLGWLRVEFTNSNTIYLIMIYFALMTPFVAVNFLAQTFIAPA